MSEGIKRLCMVIPLLILGTFLGGFIIYLLIYLGTHDFPNSGLPVLTYRSSCIVSLASTYFSLWPLKAPTEESLESLKTMVMTKGAEYVGSCILFLASAYGVHLVLLLTRH